jgi:hypothetical protein
MQSSLRVWFGPMTKWESRLSFSSLSSAADLGHIYAIWPGVAMLISFYIFHLTGQKSFPDTEYGKPQP